MLNGGIRDCSLWLGPVGGRACYSIPVLEMSISELAVFPFPDQVETPLLAQEEGPNFSGVCGGA